MLVRCNVKIHLNILGNCSAPKELQNVVTRCTNDYDMETQSTENFCPGLIFIYIVLEKREV